MTGSVIDSKKKLNILLLIFLSLSFSVCANKAIASIEPNNISLEERAALKDKTIWEILFTAKSKSKSLEEVVTLIVIKLKDESVLESLSKLHETGLYTWPPSYATAGNLRLQTVIPMPKDHDRTDVLQIINNRRVVKLIQELPSLSKAEVAGLVNQEIEASLTEYDKLYNSYFEKALKYYNTIKADPVGRGILPALPSNSPDRTPTLKGLRYKILALVLIAGNLELQDSQSAVQKVVDYAIRQRNKLYDTELFEEKFSSLMLRLVCLYNRQILGTAVLGTYLEPNRREQVLKETNNKSKTRKLKPYDQIPPDNLFGMGSLVLLDDIKGQVKVKYIQALGDSKFDDIVNAATEARKQITMPTEPKE